MRSLATPPRHKLASALAVAILALALLPMLGGQPAAIAEEARGGAAAEGGSGVPLVADALAGRPTRFVNQVVALDGDASVLGSFTIDGMTYAVTGEGTVELVAVAPATLACDLVAGLEGASSDSSEDEEASDPVALDVPDLVEHDGATYSVTSIGPRAFVGCDADMVRVSPSVASVDEAAFRGSAVGGVEVSEGNPNLASYEGVLYDADFSSLLLIPEGKKGVVRIHSNTSVVPQSAFSHCADVESIEVDAGNESFCVEDGVLYGAEGGNRAPSTIVAADARGLSRVETVYIYSMDRQGGTGGTSTVYFKPGSGLTDYWLDAACTTPWNKPAFVVERTGYAFGGYFTEKNGGGIRFSWPDGQMSHTAADIPYGSRTLYAQWTANRYNVSFDANGGSGGQSSPVVATYAAAMPTIAKTKPTRTGYTFGGWYNTAAATGGTQYYKADGTSARIWNKTSDATLYARWTANKYTVSFNPNGGAGGQSTDVTATYGSAMPTISTVKPQKTGHTFGGWYDTAAASGGTQYYTSSGASARPWNKAAHATLYARWTANKYAVSFDPNGGSGGQSANVTATYGAAMPKISAGAPSRTGYSFKGWYDSASETGGAQYYTPVGASARVWDKASAGTLYARWEAEVYVLSLDRQGGTGGVATLYQRIDTGYWLDASCAVPWDKPSLVAERAGYAFGGYFTEPGGRGIRFSWPDGQLSHTANDMAIGSRTLYAAWDPITYALVLDHQGGTGGASALYRRVDTGFWVDEGCAVPWNKPALMAERAGYAFEGYFTEPGGKGIRLSWPDGQLSHTAVDIPLGSCTLYASWSAIGYLISCDAAGGELASGARSSYTVEDAGFDLPVPARYGYQFDGWDVEGAQGAGVETVAAADGAKVTRVKAGTYGDLSCTARWTLRYDLDVPVCDPGSVTFEADSLTGQVRVKPGTSADGAILSYMAVPVALDSLSCEGLDSSGAVDASGGAPELEVIFGAGSASKVRFAATLGEGASAYTAKLTAGGSSATASLAGLSIPAAASHDAPGRVKVSYGLELDPDLAIPPVRDTAPVARLAYTVSLAGAGA